MKRCLTHISSRYQLHLFLFIFISFLLSSPLLRVQSYTYSAESFEENIWANASSAFTEIPSSTGTWTVARDNVNSTVPAADGTFSLLFRNKIAALMTPRLDNGAGVLTYQTPQGISYGLALPFSTRAADAAIAYWTQPFNDDTQFPTSQPTSPVTINVPGQGDWICLNAAYRSANPLYITDGSVSALRLIKAGGYVTTPLKYGPNSRDHRGRQFMGKQFCIKILTLFRERMNAAYIWAAIGREYICSLLIDGKAYFKKMIKL